jgi:hypothetical protein
MGTPHHIIAFFNKTDILQEKRDRLVFGYTVGRPAVLPYRTTPHDKTKHFLNTPSLRDTPLKRGYETNNKVK